MPGFIISVIETVLAGLVKDLISKWLEQLSKHRKASKCKCRKTRKAKKHQK